MVGVTVSGAQYGGDELMKFKGGDVRTLGVGAEMVKDWDVTGGAAGTEGVRIELSPFAGIDGASGTGFNKLVSWMPAGMVKISFPCWTLR